MTTPHPLVEALSGSWNVAMTTWDEQGVATCADGLRAEVAPIAGNRYAREQLAGTFAGASHEKLTLFGWNATRARFEYMTADNHDGVILLYVTSPGKAGDAGGIELFADYAAPDPTDPTAPATFVTIRTVLAVADHEHRALRNFYQPAGKPERPFLEYCYTRIRQGDRA